MPVFTEEEIRLAQRQLTDYFHHWRHGLGNRYDRRSRKDAIAKIQFPVKVPVFHNPRRITEVWDEAGPASLKNRAIQAMKQLSERTDIAGLRFVKILGWGGLGVAALFETVNDSGRRTRVVCKMDLHKEYPCVAGEIEMHLVSCPLCLLSLRCALTVSQIKRTAGANHVIQRVVLQEERKQVPPRSSRQRSSRRTTNRRFSVAESSRENRDEDEYLQLDRDEVMHEMKLDTKEDLDTDQRVLFIEYMRRGRFDDHIGKVAILKSRFPDLVLWHIFDCCKCWTNERSGEEGLTDANSVPRRCRHGIP